MVCGGGERLTWRIVGRTVAIGNEQPSISSITTFIQCRHRFLARRRAHVVDVVDVVDVVVAVVSAFFGSRRRPFCGRRLHVSISSAVINRSDRIVIDVVVVVVDKVSLVVVVVVFFFGGGDRCPTFRGSLVADGHYTSATV